MKHRIFIAINLPDDIKMELANYRGKWPEIPARWTKADNLHITLEFLGYIGDEDLPDILEKVGEIASRHSSFEIMLNNISYGPPGKMPPRMIWAIGEKSEAFVNLRADLQESLVAESKPGAPHITLARIRVWDFRKIEPEERPEVNEDISYTFNVDAIELMESKLKRGSPEYIILESYPLQ
ncbi:MAG: RNA 2',3'-cyclic phosphodiesterase [Candidatus Nealsonbacteria bacterium]|nr:RNA 2',3'-cyclic phosphodiesterase [Candidatus Nealsonbacteria bacterium]